MNNTQEKCPVCQTANAQARNFQGIDFAVDCPRCGKYKISGEAKQDIPAHNFNQNQLLLASHKIRTSNNPDLFITLKFIESLKNESLPNPIQQINNLIGFLGENTKNFGEEFKVEPYEKIAAICGTNSRELALKIIDHLNKAELIKITKENYVALSLTFKGWELYEKLKTNKSDTKKVFMAMQFSKKDEPSFFYDSVYPEFQKAVKKTGFELSTVMPEAGSIISKIELEIKTSKFIIADLSENNKGAYWEAGFATGLGKKVIYSCKGDDKPHFDVDQQYRVIWDKENINKACEDLKVVIRNTFYSEAIQED